MDTTTPGKGGTDDGAARPTHFIEDIVEEHNRSGRFGGRVHTRFPPEPNGYLHIGHAKSICLNYGLAVKYGGEVNHPSEDNHPVTEEEEDRDSLPEDVRWVGGARGGPEVYTPDYFDPRHARAEKDLRPG